MTAATPSSDNRRVRVFVSSTFRDMVEERDELMTHAWPELRRFCRERAVELVEVDLRWGITEEQCARKDTLKLCLDEIRACRPFFIALLGERYGWVPGDDAFTEDLREEQPWLRDLHGKSVTELEILHGVLNNPDMAGRAFFYFRDPGYAESVPNDRAPDFTAESADSAEKQARLKDMIRRACAAAGIPLREPYPDPRRLAAWVLDDLKTAIDARFPVASMPDPLDREAREHDAFAEVRRRTYVGRPDCFAALDRHAAGDDVPLVVLGDSGSGKSALLANWLAHWRQEHPDDVIFQHYIGSTPDSAEHWRLMARLIAEIKRWTGDPQALPTSHDDILKTFPVWLVKARLKADQTGGSSQPGRWWPFRRAVAGRTPERAGVRFIVVLDALNQLDGRDRARLLGWLPSHPFTGRLRLIVSTLPGDTLEAVQKRGWDSLRIDPLTPDERRRMIADYLQRFGKTLDLPRLQRIASAPAAANPLYLKILLDELRVTGTHERLDERLAEYLAARDIPSLLQKVLGRYERDYERDRPGLVGEALSLIWAARRGLTEAELLRLLKAPGQPTVPGLPSARLQLPPAIWNPLRCALEEGLVDRGGILNFAYDFLRSAVQTAFLPDRDRQKAARLRLAEAFEEQPVTVRSCDELPWLLWQVDERDRLRRCLLDIDRFLLIRTRDQEELVRYWIGLKEERTMGPLYLAAFQQWSAAQGGEQARIAYAANDLAHFLDAAALHAEAEPLMRQALALTEQRVSSDHPDIAGSLNNLAQLLQATNRMAEAEPLLRRALAIAEQSCGPDDPAVATCLNNLAGLLRETDRAADAGPLVRRALAIAEQRFGPEHPAVATCLNNLAGLLQVANRLAEAEPLLRRALAIDEHSLGPEHPAVATCLNNLAELLQATNRLEEAEALLRRTLSIAEQSFGPDHPTVALHLNNLAGLLQAANRLEEAEALLRRALAITEQTFGPDHPDVAIQLNNLAQLLQTTNQLAEAEPLMRRVLAIAERSVGPDRSTVAALSNLAQLLVATSRLAEAEPLMRQALAIAERSVGPDHPDVAVQLNNLAQLLVATSRPAEAEPLLRRALAIDEHGSGPDHPDVATSLSNLAQLLQDTGRLGKAEPLLRRALAIAEQSLGPDHPTVAIHLSNLAGLLQDTNRLAEAEPLRRRALAVAERGCGLDHPDVATCLNNLAGLLEATNRLEEAEPLLRRALEILLRFRRTTGHPHPHAERAVRNYAVLLQWMGMTQAQVKRKLNALLGPYGLRWGGD